MAPITLCQRTIHKIKIIATKTTKQVTPLKDSQKLFIHPVKHEGSQTIPQKKCYYGANAANRPPLRHRRTERQNQVQERVNQSDSN